MQKAADPKIKRLSLGVRMRADSGLSISAQWCQHLSIVRRVMWQSPSAAPQSKTTCSHRQASAKDRRETVPHRSGSDSK